MVGVEQWAEIRRLYFVKRLSIKEIVRRSGHGRNTIRRALRSPEAPRFRRPPRPSKLDSFREEVHRLLRSDPRLPGRRVRELLEERGYAGRRRSSMTTCARCGRCFCRGRGRPSAPRIGRARSASSTSGSRRGRSRSAAARRGAATSSSAACPTRALARRRWCSRRRHPTCCTGSAAASCGSVVCRRRWFRRGTGGDYAPERRPV